MTAMRSSSCAASRPALRRRGRPLRSPSTTASVGIGRIAAAKQKGQAACGGLPFGSAIEARVRVTTPFFARRSLKYLSRYCACRRCCSCGFTSSNAGTFASRTSSTRITCQPNCVCTGCGVNLPFGVFDHRIAERLHEAAGRVPVEVAAAVLASPGPSSAPSRARRTCRPSAARRSRPSPRLPSRPGCARPCIPCRRSAT